jgi:hypothetical protein
VRSKQESSFFEKKEAKKLLSIWYPSLPRSAPVGWVKPITSASPQTPPSGLKLPPLATNRSQTEKSFFASFFQKKKTLAFLP